MERESVPSFSHSKLTTFQQCPQKYKFRYIDEIPPPYEASSFILEIPSTERSKNCTRTPSTGRPSRAMKFSRSINKIGMKATGPRCESLGRGPQLGHISNMGVKCCWPTTGDFIRSPSPQLWS